MYGIEWMRFLRFELFKRLLKEGKMEELDHYRMRDGGVLSLQNHGDGMKWVVAYYDRGDIEQWAQEFDSLEGAKRQFDYRKAVDRGVKPIEKSGAKR